MTTTAIKKAMPALPWLSHKVRWRNPEKARAWGWEAAVGPGPFVVLRTVDHSDYGLASGLVLRTALGEQEIHEVWLAPADDLEDGTGREVAT